jgi:toxin ParE1/3/4
MVAGIVWTPLAREDLIELYQIVASDRPLAAESLYDRIEKRIDLLAFQPRSGVSRDDIRAGLRMAVVAPYLVLYEVASNQHDAVSETIVIVRIVAARRDLSEVFD